MSDLTPPTTYFGRDLEAMSYAENYHEWIFNEFKPYLGSLVAEIGAGTGNFSTTLCSEATRLVALEPSSNMYPVLQQRFAGNDKVETINQYMSDWHQSRIEDLDSVVYVNVLEHIEDDAAELAYMLETLRPGGHILIFVPALSWLYSDLDAEVGHYRRYHKQGLRHLVESAGFHIRKLHYFDFFGIVPWYIAFVLLKGKTTGSNVSMYDKLVVPFARMLESVVTPPLGKNLLLVAQKPLP